MTERRLFFALWPSERQRETMRDTINPALSVVEGTAVDRRNWHVTLVFIGNFAERDIAPLLEAAKGIDPFNIRLRFDRLTFWQRPKIASLHPRAVPPELESLVESLERILIPFGFEPNERTYRPHITVARRARAFPETPLARPLELQWSEFELVESVPSPRGVQYHPVKQ